MSEYDEEFTFLKWFYENACDWMGPADDDIYDELKEKYLEKGGKLPKGYETYKQLHGDEEG